MKSTLFAAILAGAFLLGGCGEKAKDSTEVAENANEAMVDSGATGLAGDDKDDKMDDAEWMVKAAESGMFEIQTSKLAQQRGTSADVKKFAAMMITDHTKASNELKTVAAGKNVQLPVALGTGMQEKLDELSKENGVKFDEKYMSMMKDAHEKDVEHFRDGMEDAQDPALKTFASKTLPVIEHHLSMAGPMEEKHEDHADNAGNKVGDDHKSDASHGNGSGH